ncbi:DoxX family protein [Nonomuraea jiangxiensis]|uniref:DoxX-like family protein n=1 Tax=Nonomuraea jiangxiensis TaxID=633440 RepID=A0A1G9FMQ4_9ACTN|nr:DoxX family protein [Nonomuraea jiangxiensis]SDK89674.1 DoxX-like family protein [Nonomuraea jiangxiensis]
MTSASSPARPRGAGTVVGIALWALQVVVAGFFLMSALGKFTNAEPSASTFEAIGLGDWFRHFVGVLELLGAVALFVPRLAGPAGLALVALMAGATLTELFVLGGGGVLPLILLALSAVIAWGRRESTARLWSSVTGR